jgi:hypothetical protein
MFELLFKHHFQAQRIWPLISSLTPIPKLSFGAVQGKALGKDLRKKVLTEQRFLFASAKGRQVSPSGPDPRRPGNHEGTQPFGERILIGNQTSKAPPRNPGGIPSGIPSGRTDGTWDPPIHGRNVPGRFTVWIGLLRTIHLPSFPFPGRDSNRRINRIEGTFQWDLSSSEERKQRKPIDKGI